MPKRTKITLYKCDISGIKDGLHYKKPCGRAYYEGEDVICPDDVYQSCIQDPKTKVKYFAQVLGGK